MTTQPFLYRHGELELEGHLAYDEALERRRPAVLIFHEWKGLNDDARRRAEMLASLGYVGFAADMYGKGVYAQSREEAEALMTPFVNDRKLCRARATAAVKAVKTLPQVDPDRIAVMGYCFGGLTALELARSGAELCAAVSFHGNLSAKRPSDAKKIKARVLACHGADDPHVPPAQVNSFLKSMRQCPVEWQFIAYGKTVHSFTVREANMPEMGLVYNPDSDARSWEHMKMWLADACQAATG